MKKKDRLTPRPFTKYQKEEIQHLIQVRLDTISEDPESADEFETQESLEALSEKVKANSLATDYTEAEVAWLLEELEFHRDKAALDNADLTPQERGARLSFYASMTNAINKLY